MQRGGVVYTGWKGQFVPVGVTAEITILHLRAKQNTTEPQCMTVRLMRTREWKDWNDRLKCNQLCNQTSETWIVVFQRNLWIIPRGCQSSLDEGKTFRNATRVISFTYPTKKVDVYKDTGLKGWLFIFLPVQQSTSWCGVHSTAIHLCAMGFIYTLQTFIRLIWLRKRGEREEGKKCLWKRSCCQGPILSKQKRRPTRNILQ